MFMSGSKRSAVASQKQRDQGGLVTSADIHNDADEGRNSVQILSPQPKYLTFPNG